MPKLKPDTQRARREHILDAAEHCFARAGFHRTTMQDICKEAGVSPGALYVYFDSKEALIAGICRARPRRVRRALRRAGGGARLHGGAARRWASSISSRSPRTSAPHVHRDRPGVDAQPARRRDLPAHRPLHRTRASRSCSRSCRPRAASRPTLDIPTRGQGLHGRSATACSGAAPSTPTSTPRPSCRRCCS